MAIQRSFWAAAGALARERDGVDRQQGKASSRKPARGAADM
jgi:hypothetical protein